MKTLNELQPLIIEWAREKKLIKLENAPKQRLKLLEEVGETARAILKNDVKEIKDGIGDIFVVLVILAEQYNVEYTFVEDDILLCEELPDILFRLINNSNNDFSIDWSFEALAEVCKLTKYDLTECANLAWNEIKNRKGNTVDGTFIKDEQ